MRVVSLVPSITETLLAWGIQPVAVTRFCEQPGFPTVGGTKNPDLAAISALAPDVVIVDTEENRREDHDALLALGIPVHATSVRSVADVTSTLSTLAALFCVARATESVGSRNTKPVVGSAFVPIWRRPWMTINADTYGASLLEQAGWRSVYADDPERYPTVDLDDVVRRAPAVALLPTEPYEFKEQHCIEVAAALGCPAIVVDGKDLFWWGVRTPAAIERLAAQLEGVGR